MCATGVASLAHALPHAARLSSLHLSHNSLGADGVASLFHAVAKVPSLTHVSVGFVDLGPRSAQTVGPALEQASQVCCLLHSLLHLRFVWFHMKNDELLGLNICGNALT